MIEKVEVKYICDDFLIAFKPHDLPTVPLKNQVCETALSQVAYEYPEVLEVTGKNKWEGSAMHRLDTATEGLVVFARNQKFYDYLSKVQDENKLIKTYRAICCGEKPEVKKITSYFRSFGPKGAEVKAEENIEKSDNRKLYTTDIKSCETDGEFCNIHCNITKGFRHQIRVHLSSIECPIVGDKLYNKKANYSEDEPLLLSCIGVEFPLENGEVFKFQI